MEVLFVVVFTVLTALMVAGVAVKAHQFAERVNKLKKERILVDKKIVDAKEAK